MLKKALISIFLIFNFVMVLGKTITVEELSKNLQKYTIIDARGEKDYAKGHIEGSIPTSWPELSNMKGKNGDKDWGVVELDKTSLTEKIQKLGVMKNRPVVVHADALAWGEDTRVWWTLQLGNVPDVYILSGGINSWKKNGLPVVKEKTEIKKGDFVVESINRDIVIGTDELAKNLKSYKVIDTRDKKEYEKKSLYGEVRDGHIPGSININYSEFRDKDGIFLSKEATKKLLMSKGIRENDTIVTYCTAGIRAAMVVYVIGEAGYKVKNYDASFAEWAGRKDLPVEK
ncbi:MAG: sulfurtransferase [Fusobacteriaceae bacterium]